MKIRQQKEYFNNYYWTSEGLYNSYWLGKVINAMMCSGNKKTVNTAFNQVFSFLKLKYKVLPVESVLEGLERVKPLFSLGYVTIAGKRREFPKFLSKHKQLQLSTAWFHNLVSGRRERYLSQRVFNELQDLRLTKRHALVKRRDGLFTSAIETRFNLRFTY